MHDLKELPAIERDEVPFVDQRFVLRLNGDHHGPPRRPIVSGSHEPYEWCRLNAQRERFYTNVRAPEPRDSATVLPLCGDACDAHHRYR